MNSTISPIFIVGCPRSGTTLLREMLDSHPSISCGPETQFLQDLQRIEDTHWERLTRFGLTESEWRDSVASFFAQLHERYARDRGKQRWADKSPNYALILDYVDTLFPSCQVVHIIRDGRDVVSSYRARWGAGHARHAARAWRRHIEAARGSGLARNPERYSEVRYEELVGDPEATMRRVLGFLNEPWDERVLQFGRYRRPGTGVASPEQARRLAARTGSSDVYTTSVGKKLGSRDLGARLRLRVHAGALLQELGYR